MTDRVGIVGVGHLAGYLVEGLRRADPDLQIVLSPRNVEQSAKLAARFGATVLETNQAVADTVDLVLISTRPGDTLAACREIAFRPGQAVVSVAVGLSLEKLSPAVAPATAVRALPISCAAINQSPTLLYPNHEDAHRLLALLGYVYILPEESQFTQASVLSGFYGWVYALLDTVAMWAEGAGLPSGLARSLVLETVAGAAEMGLDRPDLSLRAMLDELATPGGITRQGLERLERRQALSAWTEALEQIYGSLQREQGRP